MENKNMEIVTNEEITEVEKKPGILSRIGTGVKNHWKEGLALLGVGLLGFVLGKKAGASEVTEEYTEEWEIVDLDSASEGDAE